MATQSTPVILTLICCGTLSLTVTLEPVFPTIVRALPRETLIKLNPCHFERSETASLRAFCEVEKPAFGLNQSFPRSAFSDVQLAV